MIRLIKSPAHKKIYCQMFYMLGLVFQVNIMYNFLLILEIKNTKIL